MWIPTHAGANTCFLWDFPPAVADAGLEQVLLASHKRHDLFHVVLIPRLERHRWQRLFHKASHFTVQLPVSHPFWPRDMFEPLWVGVVLPFSSHRPWCLKRAPLLVDMARTLHEMLSSGQSDGGSVLRQLLQLPGRLSILLPGLAREVLHP